MGMSAPTITASAPNSTKPSDDILNPLGQGQPMGGPAGWRILTVRPFGQAAGRVSRPWCPTREESGPSSCAASSSQRLVERLEQRIVAERLEQALCGPSANRRG